MNKNGNDLIAFAKTLIGRKYVLGSFAPKDDPNYQSSFDCAEFIAYCNYQVFGILYGCDQDRVPSKADAYTGYFHEDANEKGIIITVPEAIQTVGAMLLRFPAPGAIGHIVFSQGNGLTVEANSTKYGCIESATTGRHFDIGILLPGVQYPKGVPSTSKPPAIVFKLKSPFMVDPFIGKIQNALHLKVDNIFGNDTLKAVIDFQKQQGLIIDGEVMPGGQTARALGII